MTEKEVENRGSKGAASSGAGNEDLKALWAEAVVAQKPPQTAAQAPAFGVNFRVDLFKTLQAIWETGKAVAGAIAAAQAPDPLQIVGVAVDAIGAVKAVLAALVETMPAINYVTYVLLSRDAAGIPEDKIQAEILAFLKNYKSLKIAWYLWIDDALIARAAEKTKQLNWLSGMLEEMQTKGFIERIGGRITFKPRNVTVDLK